MTRSLVSAILLLMLSPTATADDAARESDRYREPVQRIIDSVMGGNNAFARLTELCDDIGHRLSGSPQLDRAIQWAVQMLKADGHEDVRTEEVMVPRWVRGQESAAMLAPHHKHMNILGLGNSVGTPPEGIEAEVVVATDEADLEALGDRVKGRIVLFNNPMPPYHPVHGPGYGKTVRFRVKGPRMAAAMGAKAVLVRSVTAYSLNTPHTGGTSYGDAEKRIPGAAVTVEDAELIHRLIARGRTVRVRLKMEARMHPDVPSANVIAELRGREKPEEIVVISCHLDSWDVGQGAHDDGAGCVMAMEALSVLRRLKLQPRRTIRAVLYTNEENGLRGGKQYAEDHADELPRHVAAIEADTGSFQPLGFRFDHRDDAAIPRAVEQLQPLVALLAPLGATQARPGFSGSDIVPMKPGGVPLLGLDMDLSTYFHLHHTRADTLDKIDPVILSKNVAMMAAMAWMLAEMPGRLGQ